MPESEFEMVVRRVLVPAVKVLGLKVILERRVGHCSALARIDAMWVRTLLVSSHCS